MANLAPNASREDVEEELSFTSVLIESLDQGADDYATKVEELEDTQRQLQHRLDTLPDSSRPATSEDMNAQQYGYGWGQATVNGAPGNSEGHAYPQNGYTHSLSGPSLSSANGTKRSRPQDLSFEHYHQHPSKRLTPEPSNSSGSGSPDAVDFDSFINSGSATQLFGNSGYQSFDNSRYQQQVQQQQEMYKRKHEQERASEQLARSMSHSHSRPSSTMPSSSRPGVQTTIGFNGMFQRPPPPPPKPEQVYSTPQYNHMSTPQYQPYQQSHQHVKPESGSSRQQLVTRPRPSTGDVVDLTGSDDEEDLEEIAPANFTPSHRPVRPVEHQQYASTPQHYNMPGSYPSPYTGGPPPLHYAQGVFGTQAAGSTYNTVTALQNAYAGLKQASSSYLNDDLNNLNMLINGSRSRPYGVDEDDDLVYGGSRPLGAYAGQADLFQSRYNEIYDNDPTKTKEEINALLENIRPDEEMPQHLRIQTPEALTITLHKYQEMGLTWLRNCEEGSNRGGILADDMGLGKTIQLISLLVTHKSEDPRCKTTLILAPVALLRQWKQEIEAKVKTSFRHRLTVFIQHGPSKKKSFADLRQHDVVITTYGSLAFELKKVENFHNRRRTEPQARPNSKEQCAILGEDAQWYRVVLDEAQCIKNKSTQTAKAAYMINAKYRFCMTGTPMMNGVDEFYSLVKFLRVKPYSVWEKFRKDFSQPLKSGRDESRAQSMQRFQALCKAVMLRRTKKSKFEGRPILTLPERTTEMVNPEFSKEEHDFYQHLETQTQMTFNKYWEAGTVGKQYTQVLVLLLRLRQAACHPHLIKDYAISAVAGVEQADLVKLAQSLAPDVVQRIREKEGSFECNICMDATQNPAIFIPCGHDACSECFARITDPANAIANGNEDGGTKAKCPNCRGPIDSKQITDFASFKQVHQPELLTEAERKELECDDDSETEVGDESDDEGDDVEDSETESEEEDVKVNRRGDLKGFVVYGNGEDEATDDDEEEEDDYVHVKGADAEDYDPEDLNNVGGPTQANGSRPKARKSKPEAEKPKKIKKSKKSKGKGKAKGKKPDKVTTLADLKRLGSRNIKARQAYLRRLRKDYVGSAKIDKTIDTLKSIMAVTSDDTDDSGNGPEKVLIFSQWTSLLDLLEIAVDMEGWNYRRYDGSMNAKDRADAVDEFKTNANLRIMLISLKAGNAGLNLNMASQVIILDPFWNPFIEEQAIDRAHRLGQMREVRVHRILIKETVEDRICAIQEKKRELIGEALDEKAGNSVSRLGMQELAYLFGVTANPNQTVRYRPQGQR
ncbi:hypothetical protein LTR86_007140 [Recurvomyces mirabilis]|nr:hypothetical protein LTR86_007140 [Recurvomyces mirabilis]